MFNELGPWLDLGKAKDLLNRLENVRPNQALPAEYELAITWAVSKIATLEIDKISGSRTPDIYSPDLLTTGPMIADVAALDDLSLSGADSMRRACNIINAEADRIVSGSSAYLHFTFGERSGYERSRNGKRSFFRHRLVRRDFQLDEELRSALKSWLTNGQPNQPLVLRNTVISVVLERRSYVHPLANYFCTMPSLAYDLKDNPLYAALRSKSKQLRSAEGGVRRVVILGDAGCGLLRELKTQGSTSDHFTGGQIILKFLDDYPAIDFVIVISANRDRSNSGGKSKRFWRSHAFARPGRISDDDAERLNRILETMLPPQLSGYTAYAWHEQGMCEADAIGNYVPTEMGIGGERMTLRISARAVQDLIAGKLSFEMFQNRTMGKDNQVRRELDEGRTITSARFEPQGDDEDDDYLVLEFLDDPAARKLKLPAQLKGNPMPKG
ncbi:hypothetical protein [Granulicella sp. S156]|uniref:hypothetical protein n=1 Tax=Granulicella sp. S156 TaxID=1747224 RepID=UPI00131B9713|nr:hypothetical protein [Granulicella sp. S156]